MNSASPVVKIDTLQTLTACAENYGPQTISPYAASIWDTIRFEILSGNNEDISARVLETLQAITKSLSFGLVEATRTSPLAQFLKTVTETCTKELNDPEAKMARPAGKVLASCARVAPVSNKFIVEKTVPVLLQSFRENESVNKRTAILDILNGFLDATAVVYPDASADSVPVMVLKDDIFEVYSKGFLGSNSEETTYKLTALDGFRKLLSLQGLLADNEIGIIVQYFNDVVLKDENEDTWYLTT
jgi:DNA repair/transcription protein MET18/MMS19